MVESTIGSDGIVVGFDSGFFIINKYMTNKLAISTNTIADIIMTIFVFEAVLFFFKLLLLSVSDKPV